MDVVNSQYEALDFESFHWDINSDEYQPREFSHKALKDFKHMCSYNFREWGDGYYFKLINLTFQKLTPTNKTLLEELDNDDRLSLSKEKLAFVIYSHILNSSFKNRDKTSKGKDETRFVAQSPHSDFDFKLSPNIYRDADEDDDKADADDSKLLGKISKDLKKEQGSAGFLLLRAKTLLVSDKDPSIRIY